MYLPNIKGLFCVALLSLALLSCSEEKKLDQSGQDDSPPDLSLMKAAESSLTKKGCHFITERVLKERVGGFSYYADPKPEAKMILTCEGPLTVVNARAQVKALRNYLATWNGLANKDLSPETTELKVLRNKIRLAIKRLDRSVKIMARVEAALKRKNRLTGAVRKLIVDNAEERLESLKKVRDGLKALDVREKKMEELGVEFKQGNSELGIFFTLIAKLKDKTVTEEKQFESLNAYAKHVETVLSLMGTKKSRAAGSKKVLLLELLTTEYYLEFENKGVPETKEFNTGLEKFMKNFPTFRTSIDEVGTNSFEFIYMAALYKASADATKLNKTINLLKNKQKAAQNAFDNKETFILRIRMATAQGNLKKLGIDLKVSRSGVKFSSGAFEKSAELFDKAKLLKAIDANLAAIESLIGDPFSTSKPTVTEVNLLKARKSALQGIQKILDQESVKTGEDFIKALKASAEAKILAKISEFEANLKRVNLALVEYREGGKIAFKIDEKLRDGAKPLKEELDLVFVQVRILDSYLRALKRGDQTEEVKKQHEIYKAKFKAWLLVGNEMLKVLLPNLAGNRSPFAALAKRHGIDLDTK